MTERTDSNEVELLNPQKVLEIGSPQRIPEIKAQQGGRPETRLENLQIQEIVRDQQNEREQVSISPTFFALFLWPKKSYTNLKDRKAGYNTFRPFK